MQRQVSLAEYNSASKYRRWWSSSRYCKNNGGNFYFLCYSFWNLIDLGWKIFDFAFQFNKDSGKTIEECKLRVVYVSPSSAQGNLEDEGLVSATRSPDANSVSFGILLFALQFLWLVYDIWSFAHKYYIYAICQTSLSNVVQYILSVQIETLWW